MMTVVCALNSKAQLERGYYRIQNAYTDRYISIEDNDKNNYTINKSTGSVDMSGIKTYKPGLKVTTSPSTIVLVHKVKGSKYDFEGQGTSIHEITNNRLYIHLVPQSDGSYQAYGHYITDLYLKDDSDPNKEEAYLKPSSKSEKAMNWWARKVDTSTEYIGILPDVEIGGKFYGTIFASFPFKLVSSGMKAYVVSSVSGDGFTLQEITGEIPAAEAVIIECSSNSPARNIILPIESNVKLGINNSLFGVYCDRKTAKFFNATVYDQKTMRMLSQHNGKLAFKKASENDLTQGQFLKANKAYLSVPNNAPDILVLNGGAGGDSGEESGGDSGGGSGGESGIISPTTCTIMNGDLYTLTGIRIPEGTTPKAGIYIKNGKKIIIK